MTEVEIREMRAPARDAKGRSHARERSMGHILPHNRQQEPTRSHRADTLTLDF